MIFDCGSGERGTWTGNDLDDGPHSLSVRGTDVMGNKGLFYSRSWTVGKNTVHFQFLSLLLLFKVLHVYVRQLCG